MAKLTVFSSAVSNSKVVEFWSGDALLHSQIMDNATSMLTITELAQKYAAKHEVENVEIVILTLE